MQPLSCRNQWFELWIWSTSTWILETGIWEGGAGVWPGDHTFGCAWQMHLKLKPGNLVRLPRNEKKRRDEVKFKFSKLIH